MYHVNFSYQVLGDQQFSTFEAIVRLLLQGHKYMIFVFRYKYHAVNLVQFLVDVSVRHCGSDVRKNDD